MLILQAVLYGLVTGSIYALVALGYSLIFGVLRFINFAHGEMMTLGAYVTLVLVSANVPFFWAALAAVALVALFGMGIERAVYRPLRGMTGAAPLLTAIGLSVLLQNAMAMVFGNNPRAFLSSMSGAPVRLLGMQLTRLHIAIPLVAAAAMLALLLVFKRTTIGRLVRASADNSQLATSLGFDVNRASSFTFLLSSGLAALAGIMVAMDVHIMMPSTGFSFGVKAFIATVLGGIGSIPGAVVGGLALGVIENLGSLALPSKDAVAFIVLILVLLIRPSGLLRAIPAERV
jgi:branched-chain amino acid transport system permease protein